MAGFWRRPGKPNVSSYETRYQAFLESEVSDAFRGGLLALPIAWLTHPSDLMQAELKQVQLARADSVGVPIPATLVTTDHEAATRFRVEHSETIVKPVRYGLVSTEDPPQVAWTSSLTDDLLAHWDGSPVVLQERIRVKEHLRIVTVREQGWTCSLLADELDWREKLDNHSAFRPALGDQYEGPEDGARQIASTLHLGYSAQDWVIDESGAFYFLEANPNGQWLFLDEPLEGRITRCIAMSLETLAEERC